MVPCSGTPKFRSIDFLNSFSRSATGFLNLHNSLPRIAIRSLDLHNSFSGITIRSLDLTYRTNLRKGVAQFILVFFLILMSFQGFRKLHIKCMADSMFFLFDVKCSGFLCKLMSISHTVINQLIKNCIIGNLWKAVWYPYINFYNFYKS